MTRVQWIAAVGVLTVGMAGCTRGPNQPGNRAGLDNMTGPVVVQTRRPNLEGVAVTATLDKGLVAGSVRWDGTPELEEKAPAGAEERVTIDGQARPPQRNPRLQIHAANQGIADAVVWIVNPPAGPAPEATAPCRLTQKNGDFRPRIQAVPKGSVLQLTTADDQANFQATGAANFSQTFVRGTAPPNLPLARPGLVEVRSQVHPWMAAYAWVFDHPYFALTDADGRFRLPELPAGEYQLQMWHPSWRSAGPPVEKLATVKVGPNQGATVQFTLTGSDGR